MSKIIGLDLGTNTIGWAIIKTPAYKIGDCHLKIFSGPSVNLNQRRRMARQLRRKNNRLAYRISLVLRYQLAELFHTPGLISRIRKIFPALIHLLLAMLFAGSLLMAILNKKDFQFWLNLSITVLLGWIASKR